MDQTTNAVVTAPPPAAPPVNPFARESAKHINAGAVAIESERAIAEAQGKLIVAKRFPRDQAEAFERVMNACARPGLAATAFYSYSRGTEKISGPSIRLAEELARCWGNIDYGLRELSNRDGVSEMEAYAWDLETNTQSSQKFTVRHIRDTRNGAKELGEQRDIYELTANMGARRLRARILAILPDDLVDAAVRQCRKTIAGDNSKPLKDRIKDMISAFSPLGVTAKHIGEYLGHEIGKIVPEQLAELQGIYISIRDGQSKVGEWFGVQIEAPGQSAPAASDKPAGTRKGNAKTDKAVETKAPAATSEKKPDPVEDKQPADEKEPAPGEGQPSEPPPPELKAPDKAAPPPNKAAPRKDFF